MSARRGTSPGVERTAPAWVKILVGLHLFATVVWTLPNLPAKIQNGEVQPRATQWLLYWNWKYLKSLSPVRAYLFSTGTWQYWDMFAPDPANIDWYCTAEVEYRDGSKRVIEYPRMYSLPIPSKYIKERYRKFFERAHDDKLPLLWPSFAQTMALWAYQDRANPPVVVKLFRHWRYVADPGKAQKQEYDSYMYFGYVVDQKLLSLATEGK